MIESLKHINPRTKLLFFAIILIMLPGAIISYLSLQSINQKTENLQAKYSGTVRLVKDKLESEVFQNEANLRNGVSEQFSQANNYTELKRWLQNLESENPTLKHLFLINSDGGLISSSVSLGWNELKKPQSIRNPQRAANFALAEETEFIKKDFVDAIRQYKKTMASAESSWERALLLSRIGRCYYKSGKYSEGIKEYKKILTFGNEEITIGSVPASIVALSQIDDGYEALNDSIEQYNAKFNLCQELINHPWDLSGGEYLYYLKSASNEIRNLSLPSTIINSTERNIQELMNREGKLMEQIKFIELIQENSSPAQVRFYKLPSAFQTSQLLSLGYQIDKSYTLTTLFPEILDSVELGKDLFVGVLDEKDSALYLTKSHAMTSFLVAENFSETFVNWKVALFDPDGKSIEQLVGRERTLYLALFMGIIAIMFLGVFVTIRAVIHESEVSRMKSEFVSNVSHELKTPLALIRMFGETLDEGIVTDEKKRREFYRIIRKESERLTHLINNVLDFSRMDARSKEYNFVEADLVELVQSSLKAYKYHIRDLGFEIESELPDNMLMLKMDKDAISQVLLNLLSNAVKYSDDRKNIRVELYHDSTSALISVSDHGVGIAKDELKKIFDKFYRVTASKGKESRGSGLGLTLAKHIIEAHKGKIEVESEVGKGSRFTIRIPLHRGTS